MIKPTKEILNAIDLSEMCNKYVRSRGVDFFNGEPGKEHYKLLAWFSLQFNDTFLVEVGTLDGCGALAMSYNPSNTVTTYDIRFYDDYVSEPKNLRRKLVTDVNYWNDIMKAKFAHYDTDHNGTLERQFLDELVKRNWRGVIMFDDIHLNPLMEKFWQSVTQRKEDWTDIGHGAAGAGTGIVWL